ncbi:MAG: glutamate-cysteine ligase family protein [Planctomycetes bacterium]|nr:glutamate-cysteine ligase family protein [Planctomycetota bacterium]
MTLPLTRADLRFALERGHRPREQWALGVEYEQFVTDPQGRAIEYSNNPGVAALLETFADWTGWKRKIDRGHILGLEAEDGRALTLEPAAQLEFGSSAARSVHRLAIEVEEYMKLLARAEEEFDVRFVTTGSHPTARPEELERIPKRRYDVLEPYLRSKGELGWWMMKTTCGVQINFDHSDEEDAMRKLRTVFRLVPIFTAMFANSAVRAGELSDYVSWRSHIWTDTDPTRCGFIESLIREDATFEDYIDWVLDLEMLFIEREGQQIDMRGRTFRQHLEAGEATMEDWELHLSTPFPEVRFRPQLEIRCADTMCPRRALGFAALVQGVFYDDAALRAAESLCAHWTAEERMQSWHAAHRDGLSAELPVRIQGPGRRTLLDLARELIDLAVLAPEDAVFLLPLIELLEQGVSTGERVRELFRGPWEGEVASLVEFSRCSKIPVMPSG